MATAALAMAKIYAAVRCGQVIAPPSSTPWQGAWQWRAGLVLGLLTPEQLLHIEQNCWFETRAMDAMRAVQFLEIVTPDTPAMQVLRTMRRQAQIPVLVEGHLEGIVTRGRLVRLIDSRKHVRF